MNAENCDIQAYRNHIARFRDSILNNTNRPNARVVLGQVVQQIPAYGAHLKAEADKIPLPGSFRVKVVDGSPQMAPVTDEEVVGALAHILDSAAAALDQVEAFQTKVRENAVLSLKESRNAVLAVIAEIDAATNGEHMWSGQVQWAAGLSARQLDDALAHWRLRGAIDANEPIRTLQETAWFFRMTPIGRDIASGEVESAPHAPVLNQTFNIGVAGNVENLGNLQVGDRNTATVSQAVQVDKQTIEATIKTVREHLAEFPADERADVVEHLDVIEDELRKHDPKPSRIKAAFKAIGSAARELGKDVVEAAVSGAVSALMSG